MPVAGGQPVRITEEFIQRDTSNLLGEPLARMSLPIPFVLAGIAGGIRVNDDPTPGNPPEVFRGGEMPNYYGFVWYNIIHILPRQFVLGNVISTLQFTIEIYNAFLFDSKNLTQFINNAGQGTDIIDLPPLPVMLAPQSSLFLTLQITPQGVPNVNTTLDFETDEPYLLQIPISLSRIVAFPFEPEAPLSERLVFLTDIMESADGSEQRVSLRQAPREEFDLRFKLDDGPERSAFDLLLSDWQNQVFGVPIWIEPAELTADAAIAQTSLNVDSTELSRFREGGLAILFQDSNTFEIVEITTLGPTVINLQTGLEQSFERGTQVFPLKACVTTEPARDRRWARNLAEYSLTMKPLDSDQDLADLTGWPTYRGKILLDDPNAIRTTLDSRIERKLTVIDGLTGQFILDSTWDRARRGSNKRFIINDRTRLWSVRTLLYALRGRQVSFWLPTFSEDLTLAVPYTASGTALTIVNVGYSRYARERTPKRDIRILLHDGTVFLRRITASSEVDADTEQVTLDTPIAQDIDPDDVNRIEFIELVRIDTDTVEIQHRNNNGQAEVAFPVKVVFE